MAKNGKLPKRIAGVKIPKKLRKSGGKVKAALDNPLIADVVAAGLLLAADRIAKSKPAKKAGRKAKRAAEDAGEAAAGAAGAGASGAADVLAFIARETAKAIKSR